MGNPEAVRNARVALGRQFAALRKSAGFTQGTLAPRVRYGRSTIGNVEVGRQMAPRRFWEVCDALFKADGALLAGYDGLQAVIQKKNQSDAQAQKAQRDGALQALTGAAPSRAGKVQTPAAPPDSRSPAAVLARHPDSHPGAQVSSVSLSICGSRTGETSTAVIDAAVWALARLVLTQGYQISHGPCGVGMEVMTYIADHYHPRDVAVAVGLFGHVNVVSSTDFVLVIGGGPGTQDEIDIAVAMGKKVLPLPASGGTARRHHERTRTDVRLRSWMTAENFADLDACVDATEPMTVAETYVRFVEQLLAADPGDLHG